MGLFDWAGDAWNGATHLAGDAWNGATQLAGDVGGFVADHWKTIGAVAIGTLAFVAVATFAPELLPGLFVLAPELAPWLILGGAGAASGAATRVFDDVVDGRTPGWDVLQSAAITGIFTVATAGTLQWLAPQIGEAVPFLKPLTDRFVIAGSEAGAGADAVDPVIPVPVAAPAESAASETPAAATEAGTSEPQLFSISQAIWRAPKTRGIIGLVAGDTGDHANRHIDAEHREDHPPVPAPTPAPGPPPSH
jgi:hypothetical protein